MKILKTANYSKIAKDKAEDFDVNPWAVCHTTVDKEKDPEKYEKCVLKVKQKHRKKSSHNEWLKLLEAKDKDKWIQDAVPESHEGKFGKWCKRNGFSGVSQACINKAISAGGNSSQMANFAINVSKGKYHHPNKEK